MLVGRESELRKLKNRITSSELHPTIEGDNGVGKTSIVSVAAFQLKKMAMEGNGSQVFLPLEESFQLSTTENLEAFENKVYYAVAQTLIDNRDLLQNTTIKEFGKINSLKRWLNSGIINSGGLGVNTPFGGASGSKGSSINSSAGYSESGFKKAVNEILFEAFPAREAGGVICVIDNLELMQTSGAVRRLLEELRDGVLSAPGLIWILCGARGIVRTVASSWRAEGRYADPIEISPIEDDVIEEMLSRRIDEFQAVDTAIPPVGVTSFRYIYDILHNNLRNAFKYSEDFSVWLADEGLYENDSNALDSRFATWIQERAKVSREETQIGNRAWSVFNTLAERGGKASPGDYSDYGFESSQAMRPHIKNLEEAQLVSSTSDENDKRRRTIVITARGWLVHFSNNAQED